MTDGITVTGTGRVLAPPDQSCLSLAAEATARDAQRALEAAQEGLVSMRRALTEAGIAESDLRTSETSLWSERMPADRHTARLGLEVTVRDLTAAGGLLSLALGAAGDVARMNGISFTHSDPQALYHTARERAWDDACTKAEQLAALAGRSLGEVTSIIEGDAGPPRPVGRSVALAAAEAMPVDPGEQAVTATVMVTWAWG